MNHVRQSRTEVIWQLVLRIVVGTYWIYFALMKWFDRSWVGDLLSSAANGSYLPGYSQLLKFIAGNSGTVSLAITIVETVVGAFILLGILTRVGATIGAILGLNLMLTFVFCRCPWTQSDFPLVFWFYALPIFLNLQVAFDKSSSALGLQRILKDMHV